MCHCVVQANSVPASFWTLTLLALPSSRGLVADIRAEAAQIGDAASPRQQAVQVWPVVTSALAASSGWLCPSGTPEGTLEGGNITRAAVPCLQCRCQVPVL